MTLAQLMQTHADALAGLSDRQAADYFNAPRVARPRERMITKRTLFSALGVVRGTAVIETLRGYASSDANPARAIHAQIFDLLDRVETGGLDISLPESRQFVADFVHAGLLSAGEAAALTALGQETVSLAEDAGLGRVHYWDVARVRAQT